MLRLTTRFPGGGSDDAADKLSVDKRSSDRMRAAVAHGLRICWMMRRCSVITRLLTSCNVTGSGEDDRLNDDS